MNKEDIKIIIIIGIIIIIFIKLLISAFIPTEEDKKAYNTCMEQYGNNKTCNKLVFGNY
jgi:uncharacterized protein YpmB